MPGCSSAIIWYTQPVSIIRGNYKRPLLIPSGCFANIPLRPISIRSTRIYPPNKCCRHNPSVL